MLKKRVPSKKNLEKICAHLGLAVPSVIDELSYKMPHHTWNSVESDVFASISQWYHFAIIELIKIHKGKLTAPLIARRLGIREMEARTALERLQRLQLIEKKGPLYVDLNHGFASYYDGFNTSVAQKALMAHMLEKAKDHIQQTPIESRDHSSVTMCINKKDLNKAKTLLKNFRREFTSLMEKTSNPDEIYELTLAFYPLTKD